MSRREDKSLKGYKQWAAVMMSLLLGVAVSACGNQGTAESAYPSKQVEYIVPYSAGGGVDLVARAAADYLSKEWGQPIVVVNKAGGGGAVGAEYALKQAKNDGYTALAVNVSNTTMLAAGMKTPPITNEDQVYTARIGKGTLAFAVKADAPWKDFAEFSAWVRANPEQLTWTSVGPAGFSAFGVAEWLDVIGADFAKTRMIVTKGASDSVPKVAGGHAVLAVHTVGEIMPMLQAGKVKVLAVSGDTRSPFLPDVPTAEEQGIQGLSVFWWTGVSFAKGTPESVIRKWEEAIAKMEKDPAFLQKLSEIQVEPAYAASEAFTKETQAETTYYLELATKKGIRK
ncbi:MULTISPECIES: tripartite tricarboxylate transporter substrate binding protein [Brevibacillus]|uniref:tripartite tricarboxylate transporter substrate binding protein n=1 Tax=Brevibacillus TaxID=55080 RepID=UPI000D10843B|nr:MULTISPECIES: tripartite tricarboxylate transporter substrate binding protein [Brevibacillus]MED1945577.1 tripartite tricarboxylate transporter substrate binding protein [Brevibacillus formosus]MED2000790.1 tripartite tricarboxylate transporter substrate binding protein [Brevibacillus formosus]MED2084364.1 tripartite tricarboxylate transporter substrate binding protein [Brevibacillus formosus]PSK15751.1 tripartite tricarboxylate transporter substrate binding protein [Brevibacillus sp. NRRL N